MPVPPTPGWDFEPYVHYAINDETGAPIVVEYPDGALHVFDNPLGTITNAPEFPWHRENLRQYTGLPVDQVPPLDRSAAEQGPTGLDIGTKANLPGEITSPNRFVRASLYSQYALPFKDAREGVQRVLNILSNFDIPLGYKSYAHADGKVYPQYTQWTSVTDLRDRRIYFWTFFNPNLQMIGLGDLDMSGGEIRFIPVNTEFSARAVSVPQRRKPVSPGGTRSGIWRASCSARGSPPGRRHTGNPAERSEAQGLGPKWVCHCWPSGPCG